MRALLDISLLIALFDPVHVHHNRAHAWWGSESGEGWSSCPLTQNGFVRVLSSHGYARPIALVDAIAILRAQIGLPGHEFWPDDVSLMDGTVSADDRIVGAKQLTDVYLLGLAVKHGGRLATLDRSIPLTAVRGAQPQHLAIV